ncbi:MAG: hypothetical protein ACTSX6_12790 [Candidatus Heimdallarchaeaceae archaeon]
MGRKSARELIKRILQSITDSPKSIHEIAQDAESNWESVKEYLESLKEAGIVQEGAVGNKRVFSLVTGNIPKKNGNYFDLPILEKDDKLISSLFSKIKEEWKRVTEKEPGQIQVQKSLRRIDRLCKLNLPIGWYLFGAMCVKPYNPLFDYEYQPMTKEIEECVHEVVLEYSKEPTAYSLKIRQYKEENKILYQTKELILSLLTSSRFSKKYISEINKLFYDLINNLPKINDSESKSLINEFVGVVFQLINNISNNEIQFVKPDILQAFNEVWKLIALYEYSTDLESYYEANYDSKILLKHFNLDISLQKFEVKEHISYLDSLTPSNEEPDDDTYRNLKKILSSGRLLSLEEQKVKEKELEIMSDSELLRKFGLN